MRFATAILSLSAGLAFSSLGFAQESPQKAVDEGNTAQAVSMLDVWRGETNVEKAVSGAIGRAQIAQASQMQEEAMKFALEADEKAEGASKQSGWQVVAAWTVADIAFQNGDLETARRAIRKAESKLAGASALHPMWYGAVAYTESLIWQGDNAKARKAAENALSAFEKVNAVREIGLTRQRLADLEWERGKIRRALIAYDAALRSFKKIQDHKRCAKIDLLMAERYLSQKEIKAAKAKLAEASQWIGLADNPSWLVTEYEALEKQLNP